MISTRRAILIFAVVVAFTAVLAFVFVVRDSDGDVVPDSESDSGGTVAEDTNSGSTGSDSSGTSDTDSPIDYAVVCQKSITVPEYDLCREIVRCNERFSEELLGNDCKIRAFKDAIKADVDIVSVAVALDEGELGATALEEYIIEEIIEFNLEGLEEFGPDFEPLPLPEPGP